jgi:O-antigen ligase
LIIALISITVVGLFVAIISLATTGSKTHFVEGLIIAILPIATYAAIKRPFIFPFGLYVLLVPYDSLLKFDPRFGTVTKLVAMSAGVALVFWLMRNKRCMSLHKSAIPWLALLVWMALSVFWALDQNEAASRLATYAELVVLYLVISLIPLVEQEYKVLLITVALSGVAAAAYGVYLYHTGAFTQYSETNGVMTSRLLVRFGGTDKWSPDELSAALLLPVALVMNAALKRPWSLAKMGLIGLFIVLVGGMYVNGSRGALVALAAMVGYMILRSRFKSQLVSLSVLALGVSFLMPTSPWARFATAASTGGSGRIPIWKVGLAAFKQHWLIGAGVGNFPTAYDQSFIGVYQSHFANWDRAPHNTPLEFGVELGVIGLALLFTGWIMQMRSLRDIELSSRFYDTRIALEAAVLAVFIAGLFVGIMSDKFLWLLFGVMAVTRTMASLGGSNQRLHIAAQPTPIYNVATTVKERVNA